jgi:hypothetical protein
MISNFEQWILFESMYSKNDGHNNDGYNIGPGYVGYLSISDVESLGAKKVRDNEYEIEGVTSSVNIIFKHDDDDDATISGIRINNKFYNLCWHCIIAFDGIYLNKIGWFASDRIMYDKVEAVFNTKSIPNSNLRCPILNDKQISDLLNIGFEKVVDFKKLEHKYRGNITAKNFNI